MNATAIKQADAPAPPVPSSRPDPAMIAAAWEQARKDYQSARSVLSYSSMDNEWLSFFARRGGLQDHDELALAQAAQAHFAKRKAEAEEALASAQRKTFEAHQAERHSAGMATDARAWAEANLAPLWQLGADLRETAAIIELGRGKPPISPLMAYSAIPSIGSDPLLLETLCADVEARLKAAHAVLALVRADAAARERAFDKTVAASGKGRK